MIFKTDLIEMADYHLEILDDENLDKWDDFNIASPEGSLFHSLKWKEIVEKSSNIKEQYFLLYKGEDVIGLFPFIEEKIRIFRGRGSLSDPHHLNVMIKDTSDYFAMQYVIRDLQNFDRQREKISFVRLSTLHEGILDTISSYPLFRSNDLGDMVLDLSESPPEKLWDSFSAKKGQRKFVRRFDETGFIVTEASSLEDIKLFYRYYEENMRYIKGRLRPFSRFLELWDSMSDEIRITLLSKGSIFAGGMLQLRDIPRKTLYTTYLSLNRSLPNTYHPSYYLWWEAINWAWENNIEKISFGVEVFDEKNPGYRVKSALGAQYQPKYSGLIPLTRTFTLGTKWRWRRSGYQSPHLQKSR